VSKIHDWERSALLQRGGHVTCNREKKTKDDQGRKNAGKGVKTREAKLLGKSPSSQHIPFRVRAPLYDQGAVLKRKQTSKGPETGRENRTERWVSLNSGFGARKVPAIWETKIPRPESEKGRKVRASCGDHKNQK